MALFIFDEIITGFRYHLGGAQKLHHIEPDLATFGKALGNGYSISALVGKREFMKRGGLDHDAERVFLLSTTFGTETHALAAAIETMRIYREEQVVEYLDYQGGGWPRASTGRWTSSICTAILGNRQTL
jgi:glutamate-1-semialdehyde 2,1-aminomutase